MNAESKTNQPKSQPQPSTRNAPQSLLNHQLPTHQRPIKPKPQSPSSDRKELLGHRAKALQAQKRPHPHENTRSTRAAPADSIEPDYKLSSKNDDKYLTCPR